MEADYTDIPLGAVCQVKETDSGGADASKITPDSVVVGGDDSETSFEVINTFGATPTSPPPTAAPPPPGNLPNTGGPGLVSLILGLILTAAGALVITSARIRRRRS